MVAAGRGERRAYLLEKDIWVVETLKVLVQAAFGRHLTFKGGTSLAKVWRAIRRFSGDIDITYDIRAFAPDLVGGADDEALPPTRSQEQRWTKAIRHQLASWVREQALPTVEAGLARDGFVARVRAEGERLYVGYEPAFDDYGFVRPEVLVDFGTRSTGEPRETRPIECDAAAFLPDLSFPEACPAVMLAERTFWEKATSMHVFCLRQRGRGSPTRASPAQRRPGSPARRSPPSPRWPSMPPPAAGRSTTRPPPRPRAGISPRPCSATRAAPSPRTCASSAPAATPWNPRSTTATGSRWSFD